jgi:hypothetical protein
MQRALRHYSTQHGRGPASRHPRPGNCIVLGYLISSLLTGYLLLIIPLVGRPLLRNAATNN